MELIEEILKELSEAGHTASSKDVSARIDKMKIFKVPESEIKSSLLVYFGVSSKNKVHGDNPINPIAEVTSDGTWTSLKIKVVQLWENNHESISQAGVIGDESGTVKFTAWASAGVPKLVEGECYVLKNVVSSIYNEKVQISLNKKSVVEDSPDAVEVKDNTVSKIGVFVSMTATSGLITRCSTCKKAIHRSCDLHPEAEGYHDLRVIGSIDNGVTCTSILMNAEIIASVSGITVDSGMQMATEDMDKGIVGDTLKKQMMGQFFYITGADLGDSILVKSMMPYVHSISDDDINGLISYIQEAK